MWLAILLKCYLQREIQILIINATHTYIKLGYLMYNNANVLTVENFYCAME